MADQRPVTRRIKMTVGELSDVDVLRISIVDRGANRVPFRVTKREGQAEEGNGVLNFGRYFQKEDPGQETLAEVAGVAISSSTDLEKAKELIKGAGYSIDAMVEGEEGHRVFVQGDAEGFDPDACQYIKFSENHGVFVKGATEVQKGASRSFGENLGAKQFIPGLYMAHDAFTSTVSDILDDVDMKRDEAVAAIKSAAGNYSEFVGTLADQIPEDVFKLEKAFDSSVEADPKVEDKKDGDGASGGQAQAGDQTAAAKSDESKAKDGEGEGEANKGEGDQAGTSGDEGKAKKSDPGQDGNDPVLKAIEGLSEKLEALGGKVDGVQKTAEEAKALAQKADKASTAVGGQPEGDQTPALRFHNGPASVEKGDQPLIDTAYGRPEDD